MWHNNYHFIFSSVQLFSHAWLFAAQWTAAHQAPLPITNSQSLLRLTSIESVMPSNILILFSFCLQSFPASGSFSVSQFFTSGPKVLELQLQHHPSNEYSGLISFRVDWFDLLAGPRDSQESSPTPQVESINSLVLSFLYGPTLTSIYDYWKIHSFD